MNRWRRGWVGCLGLACAVLLALGGCAGSGDDLDEFGNPISETEPAPVEPPVETPAPDEPTPEPPAPTFSEIQSTILVPFCVCHVSAAPPVGLSFAGDAAFDMLVATPSVQIPERLRVEPGSPDTSYLIHKLEGGPNIVGFQMPPTELGEAHLPQETIDLVRQWIEAGAFNNNN